MNHFKANMIFFMKSIRFFFIFELSESDDIPIQFNYTLK